VEQARADMANLGAQLRLQYPTKDANMSATVQPMSEFQITGLRTTMAALLAAVGFVLLIACVNIANLLLARASARQRELAVRRALGASGLRIARQALTESVLLSLLGGACGVLLAAWCTSILPLILPRQVTQLPVRELQSIPIDVRVLGFALLISVFTGILFGLAPAIHAIREGVSDSLKEGGRGPATGRNRLRQVLVSAEVGLALVVLCGAGLMIESVAQLLGVELGFNPKNVLTMSMTLPQEDLYNGPPSVPRFCEELTERVAAIPGVNDVGAVAHLPLEGGAGRGFVVEGRPDPGPGDRPGADYSVACPGYFRTMGVRILRGREFTNQDKVNAPGVIVIDQAMAERFWPGEDPIGRAIDLGGPGGTRLTVVGEVADMRHRALDEAMHPQFFRPYTQAAWPWMSIVTRTQGRPESYAPAVKKAIAEVEPDRPVSEVGTMEEIVQDALGPRRFPTILLASFALLALVLSAVGIVGVVGYSVAQRTQEIGIRMALGARPRDVLALVLRGSMTWVFAGIALGIAGSLSLTRMLGILLYGIRPSNPEVLGTAALLLAVVALVASYIPARRAAKVDPMVALRYE
jgi:putative ABC transport system permease protein